MRESAAISSRSAGVMSIFSASSDACSWPRLRAPTMGAVTAGCAATHATAALHDFRDAYDYWARVGCGQFLPGVRVPLLLVSAADDPFNPGSTLPHAQVAANPWLVPSFAERGGHVGFVHGVPWRTRHWAEEQVERFFAALDDARR